MTVIISTRLYHREIYLQLREHQIPEDMIIDAGRMIDDANRIQYFDLPELKKHKVEDEVFVDVGAFDVQTSAMFVQWAGKYKKVFVLEPDPQNREKYVGDRRKLMFGLDEIPFSVVKNNDELSANILSFDEEKYRRDMEEFIKRVGILEDG